MFNRRSILTGSASAAITGAAVLGSVTSAAHAASPVSSADARQYGVEPNAARNQTQILQRAIDEAASTTGQLFLPAGTFVVAGLTINQPLTLWGIPGRTRLIAPSPSSIIKVENTNDVTLTGLLIDGAGSAPLGAEGALLNVANCQQFSMENCQIINSIGNGAAITGSTGHIRSNTIARCRSAALHTLDNQGLQITANHIHDCSDNGILIWQSAGRADGATVTQNRIERIAALSGGSGQNGNGINIYRAGSVIISQNNITDCAYSAVRNNAGSNVQILANNCTRLGEVALYAEFEFQGAVISDNIVDQAAAGISITNFSSGGRLAVCANNIITNLFKRPPPDTRGVGIAVEADTVVTGNIVENAPEAGLALGWGTATRNISATGNITRRCKNGIIASVTPGAQSILIANNIIAEADTAIVGMDHETAVTGDLTKPGVKAPGNLTMSGNSVS